MRMIFVNLPVKDVKRSIDFFAALGFKHNPQFTDESAACIVIDENIFAMAIGEERFKDFINGEISDPSKTEVLTALSCESREEVDSLLEKALANGGSEWKPKMDMGPMYGASFRDPDYHVWELSYMDMEALGDEMPEAP
ncbi:MAG: VOC family protein, partial [Actinomycetota bacterium]|nr:VOC family protein [Actinomycetota bacterium]